MRARLAAKGHPEPAIEEACSRLAETGYLDDGKLALDFIATRAERLGHGPEKLLAALRARGVEPDEAEAALRLAVERGDLAPREVLRQRLPRHLRGATLPLASREYARVYNALRRAGFDDDAIRKELGRCGEPASHTESATDEIDDDFA